MHRLPREVVDEPAVDRPTWRRVVAGYVPVGLVLLGLVLVSNPLTGVFLLILLALAVGLVAGIRRMTRLVRCFDRCGGFSVHLGRRVRITIDRPHT